MVNSVGDDERTFKCKWPYIYGKRDSIELPNEATKSEKKIKQKKQTNEPHYNDLLRT